MLFDLEEETEKASGNRIAYEAKEHHFGCDCMIEGKSMSRIGG